LQAVRKRREPDRSNAATSKVVDPEANSVFQPVQKPVVGQFHEVDRGADLGLALVGDRGQLAVAAGLDQDGEGAAAAAVPGRC